MSPSSKPPPKLLRLVAARPEVRLPAGTQMPLPLDPPARMFVVNMSVVTKHVFVGFLKHERPRVLVDLRPVPSFSLDAFSRRAAFQLFEECEIHYFDVGAALDDALRSSMYRLASSVAERITKALMSFHVEPDRVGLLFEEAQAQSWTHLKLHEAIRPSPKSGWKLELVPQTELSIVR
jgi:hypothetical protein